MQENQKHRLARDVLEDLAKHLGLEVFVKRINKVGLSTCLRFKHRSSGNYASILDRSNPLRRIFSGWGFDETDAAEDALDCILHASRIYWSVPDGEMLEHVEVDLSLIDTEEELEIAIDLGSLKTSSRFMSFNNAVDGFSLSC